MKVNEGMKLRRAGKTGKPGESGIGKPKAKAFSAVLKEKKTKGGEPEAWEEKRRLTGELEGAAGWRRLAPPPVQPQPQPQAGTPAPAEVEKPRAAAEVRQLDQVVEEIVTAVREDGSTQIDIQLDSRTFDGLGIQITGDRGGAVAIQFVGASPQVERLLTENMANLSDALARRDLNVSEIRIAPRKDAGPWKGGAGGRQRRR